MAGYITYLIIVAVPAYLLAWLAWPPLALAWVGLLAATSLHRYLQNREDPTERKAFFYMSIPVYVFTVLMVVMWFMV